MRRTNELIAYSFIRVQSVTEPIYKVVNITLWEQAGKSGAFEGSADDRRDGFIHFSKGNQLHATLQKHFKGVDNLVLIAVDGGLLGSYLRWEISRGGDLFPHLYGALPMKAVLWSAPLPLDRDGRHVLPPEIS
jgi:uncharacterized protein (DUF952 family)